MEPFSITHAPSSVQDLPKPYVSEKCSTQKVAQAHGKALVCGLVDALRREKGIHARHLGSAPAEVADIGGGEVVGLLDIILLELRIEQSVFLLLLRPGIEDADGGVEQVAVAAPHRIDGEHARVEQPLIRPAHLKALVKAPELGVVRVLHAALHLLGCDRRAVLRAEQAGRKVRDDELVPLIVVEQRLGVVDAAAPRFFRV